MTVPGVEIIDLTESSPQSPALSETSVRVRSLRRQKRAHSDTTSSDNSPIVISDADEAASSTVPPSSVKKRKPRKKKKKQTQLEEGEVASGSEAARDGKLRPDGKSAFDGRETLRSDARLPAHPAMGRGSSPLFFLDDKPEVIPGVDEPANTVDLDIAANLGNSDSLLLPEHVKIDAGPQTKEPPVVFVAAIGAESDTDDFIHYADAELNLFTRYYEEPKDESERKAHLVCGQCGAEGDHKQADCPVVVCLTCGVHNEHSTHQCPIVKTCFSCGMKGHINKDCPNKHVSRRMAERNYDCSRCGSYLHRLRECPTLWRLYEYLDDAERETTLKSRREKENLPIGQGGEGYVGEDYWCYNCGGEGHLGDDCKVEARNSDSREPSAFGSFNMMSGPFADREHARSEGRKLRREWELNDNFDDGHGFAGPSNVGKRGRDKERERMSLKETEMRNIDEDGDDWFGSRLQSRPNPHPKSSGTERREPNERAVFKFQNGDRNDRHTPKLALMDRISSGHANEGGTRRRDRRRSTSPQNHRGSGYRETDGRSKRGRERKLDLDRGRDRDEQVNRRQDLPYRGSGGDAYGSSREDRKRTEERSRRQYYGDYAV